VLPAPYATERIVDYLARVGSVFARFGADTQDSGNVSYGLAVDGSRYFVKTAGDPGDTASYLSHPDRVGLLHNAARLASSVTHPVLPTWHGIGDSAEGPMLVYEWRDGEHLGTTSSERDDPGTAFQRFRALPSGEILIVLDQIFDLHEALTRAGWIEGDFYDGALLYDFGTRGPTVMDLDGYRLGPYRNDMGRMFGSTRFMAPEEFELGASIDERTTLFVMARTALVLLSDGTLEPRRFRGSQAELDVLGRALDPTPANRHRDFAAFHDSWRCARMKAG
jgi:serine/threonine protein kinase